VFGILLLLLLLLLLLIFLFLFSNRSFFALLLFDLIDFRQLSSVDEGHFIIEEILLEMISVISHPLDTFAMMRAWHGFESSYVVVVVAVQCCCVIVVLVVVVVVVFVLKVELNHHERVIPQKKPSRIPVLSVSEIRNRYHSCAT